MQLTQILLDARTRAQLSEALMSSMVGIEETRIQKLETGQAEPTPEELDAYAQVFGLRMDEFVAGQASQAPLTNLFFRSASEGGLESLQELIAADGQFVIGDFMRCVRDILELELMLARHAPPQLPMPPKELSEIETVAPYGADKVAEWFRAELGLGQKPIPSMIDLLNQKLGVELLWVTPDELHPVIDGASTPFPRPAILVNLVEGPHCWWRTRMTLGHELCHLLCDYGSGSDRFAIFSPHALKETVTRWHLFDGFERIERRASAFAVCLLAPAEAVKKTVGARDATSEEAIALVGKTFGLGRTTSINRLQHVFRFSKQTRLAMEARSASHWTQWDHPDRVLEGIGLRAGVVARLSLEALAQGKLDRVRVRGYLKLPLTEPLPEYPGVCLSEAERAPLRRMEERVQGIVQQYLQEEAADAAGCFATKVEAVEGGFRVEVVTRNEGSPDAFIPCGYVIVSYDLNVIEVALTSEAQCTSER